MRVCRASIVTGRNTWQLKEGSCHGGLFPSGFAVYPDLLEQSGYFVGYTCKGAGSRNYQSADFTRDPAGPNFDRHTTKPPATSIRSIDYARNFEAFLSERPADRPFCFWMGFSESHRGYELGSGRDWARLANLYLQDGVWNGERLLPEGYVKFVSTLAPAWESDKRPVYGGGLFWLNGENTFPAPKEAFYMSGVGGQTVLIIPSHQLAIVRLGHYKGAGAGGRALRNAVKILMETLPPA